MSSERSNVPVEIAHVLFIDIVGYSKLLIEDQQAAVRELNKIARGTAEYETAEAAGKLITDSNRGRDGTRLFQYT